MTNRTIQTLQIPIRSLPENEVLRQDILSHYFQEMLVSSIKNDNFWGLELSWPADAAYYIDPQIEDMLKKWNPNLSICDIYSSRKEYGKYQESLNDNWTLYAWSRWWKETIQQGALPDKITILHLDDHDDLMSPKLYVKGDSLHSLLNHRKVQVSDPSSIESAISDGSVGIGEFILPFLWDFPGHIEIRHLCQRPTERKNGFYTLDLKYVPDRLNPHYQRLTASLEPIQNQPDAKISYFLTDSPEQLLDIESTETIFLHIDMDYFNNRYDGCSDWSNRGNLHNPDAKFVISSLERFLNLYEEKGLSDHTSSTAVATSPGFFPSEMWDSSLKKAQQYFLKN